MALKKLLLTGAALPLLAACAASNGLPATDIDSYIASTTADGTLEEVITSTGVTGYMGNSDGTISEVRVRIDMTNPESPAFYLSKDGGAEENFYIDTTPEEAFLVIEPEIGGFYDLTNDAGDTLRVYVNTWGASGLDLERLAGGGGDGVFGLQTEVADLPTGTPTYWGGLSFSGGNDAYRINGGGNMELTVDFNRNRVLGNVYGGYGVMDEDMGGGFNGVVLGDIEGSEMTGTMTIAGNISGDLDMEGAFYGMGGYALSGGFGGNVSSSELGDMTIGGSFDTSWD